MAERGALSRVFVSSASGALEAYRRAAVEVCHRLSLLPVHQEEFGPDRRLPLDECRRLVTGSDVVVLLLAHRYGSRPPREQRSYTELEYEWALTVPGLALLPFVVDQTHLWDPTDIDTGADARALHAFIKRVTTAHVVKQFSALPAFREDLLLALQPWSAPDEGPRIRSRRRAPTRPPQLRRPQPPAFHTVPPYVGGAPFTGRAADLATLDEWGASVDPVMVVEAIGGTGKSALTWEWARNGAAAAVHGLTGRLWWSFYDGSASISRFLRELLLYTEAFDRADVMLMTRTELADEAVAVLRSQPYLVVLDGFERLLAAYHRFDPSKLRDDEVPPAKRSLIEAHADGVVRALAGAGPSKILISSRLMPDALEGRFGRSTPGVRRLRLPGLTDADTATLLERLSVHGSGRAMRGFFQRLGNHPLLIGVVAGLINDYRQAPGAFDQWLADPDAGGKLALPDLDLVQRRAHILEAALAGLMAGERRLLGLISVSVGALDWATLQAANPYRPERPSEVLPDYALLGPEPVNLPAADRRQYWVSDEIVSGLPESAETDIDELLRRSHVRRRAMRRFDQNAYAGNQRAHAKARQEWHAEADRLRDEAQQQSQHRDAEWQHEVERAKARLDQALQNLEERGLLWWDRPSNTYDLHPVVRAYVHDQLDESERIQANDRVRNHFETLPEDDLWAVTSVEDLRRSIVIFRTWVGAGRFNDACRVWSRGLNDALGERLGAYTTVVELLSPLAQLGEQITQADLATAYTALGRHQEALQHEERLLGAALAARSAAEVKICLLRLATDFREVGAAILAGRCLELRADLLSAVHEPTDAAQLLALAGQAAEAGQSAEGQALLGQAQLLPTPRNYPWFKGDVRLWGLHLALAGGDPAILDQLASADAELTLWTHRRWLAQLRYTALDRAGKTVHALEQAQLLESLGRNAGVETVPAESAVQLALLERLDEACAAVNEALARVPTLHPAARPHLALARALQRLGRDAEAVEQATLAYRQAWQDGPPHSRSWALQDAAKLLTALGQTPPDLPVSSPGALRIPLESEVRAFIQSALGVRW